MKTVAEIRAIIDTKNIQVVAIQEPYTIRGKVASFGSMARVVSGEKKGETAWSAIIVFDPKLVVMRLEQFCDSHIVCAQIDDGKTKIYVVSGYFQYSKPIGPYLQKLDTIIRNLRGHKVVVCADANAKSPIWFSDDVSNEGILLENLITEQNLYVVNESGNPKTYSQPGGEGNIDVTLATEALIRTLNRWEVKDGWVSSDHRAITFEANREAQQEVGMELGTTARFITKKAKWDLFDKAFSRKAPEVEEPKDQFEVILLARKLRRALIESCKESMPTKGKSKTCAKWWSNDLTEAKNKTHKLRREFQKAKKNKKSQQEIDEIRGIYYRARRDYDKKIYRTRTESWKEFIAEAAANPWGYAYKLGCNKIRAQQVMNSINTNTGKTTSGEESAELLLDNLFCNHEPLEDTEQQAETGAKLYEEYKGEEDRELITEAEIHKIIRKMKTGKAPGWDRIEVEVIKRAWTQPYF